MDPGYAVAAKAAVECDPNAVEALATLDDFARSADDEIGPVMIVGYLLPGVRVKDGTARWIRDTLDLAGPVDSRSSVWDDEPVDDDVPIDLEPGGGYLDVA
jgi:hypothetical protein